MILDALSAILAIILSLVILVAPAVLFYGVFLGCFERKVKEQIKP